MIMFDPSTSCTVNGATPLFFNYQLNLILDDEFEARLLVAFQRDLPDLVQKAQQLAEFLRVPFLPSLPIVQRMKSEST